MDTVIELQTDKDGQHLTLPPEFRLDADKATVRRDPVTGDLVLSVRPPKEKKSWEEVFKLLDEADFPKDFMADRGQDIPETREWT